MIHAKHLILASTSPFRKKILEDAGISFSCVAAQGDEKTIAGLPPKILAAKRAEFKAIDVAHRSLLSWSDHRHCIVVAAD